jgi:hypothetical protein
MRWQDTIPTIDIIITVILFLILFLRRQRKDPDR